MNLEGIELTNWISVVATLIVIVSSTWSFSRLTRRELQREIGLRFDSVNDRFDRMDARFDRVDARFERLESSIDDRFDKVDARFERLESSIDARFERLESSIDARFDKVDARFVGLDQRIHDLSYAVGKSTGRLEGPYPSLTTPEQPVELE